MWNVIATQDEASWFDSYIIDIISSAAPKLPPHEGALGHTDWFWFSPEPGKYYIQAQGGTINDRLETREYVSKQLEEFGLQHIAVSWTGNDREQVQQKALRLIRENKVQVHDNAPALLSGTVVGDHGTYQPEIQRDPSASPRSQSGLISGHCQCDWGNFMNQPRTRGWKQYQNAPCAHLMALWWLGQSMPLDDGSDENSQQLQQGQGDMGQFSPLKNNPIQNFAPQQPGANFPALTPRPDTGTTQTTFGPDEAQGFSPEMPPNPEGALPQAPPPPADPNGSVPGKVPTSPSNPIQYPGGTFSSVKESADMFNEGQMVQLKNDDWATGVGQPGYGGVGEQIQIPAGTVGEVREQHPSTGMVHVFYNQGPFLGYGKMMAHGGEAWHWPTDLQKRPDLRGQSPMIKRV